MGDWCECKKPDIPGFYDKDYTGPNPPCRKCGKKVFPEIELKTPGAEVSRPMEIKAYCPERHELKSLEILFNINWKHQVIHYISGYCEKCNKVFCVGDDMIQSGVGQ